MDACIKINWAVNRKSCNVQTVNDLFDYQQKCSTNTNTLNSNIHNF